jgi:hypothetical protein
MGSTKEEMKMVMTFFGRTSSLKAEMTFCTR